MALKLKITKADYDALPEVVRAEYKASGMDFVLDVDGYEDPAELKRAKDREKQRADDEKKRADAATTRVTELETELADESTVNAKKKGDIATLEASWKQKVTDAEKKGTDAVAKLRKTVERTLLHGTAEALAKELSESPALLLPHITSRLTMDFDGEEPSLRVLGTDGKLSAASLNDLRTEFVANKDFAAIITGSKAAGGGAPGGKQGGAGGTKKLSEMNESERTAYAKANPDQFKKESAEAKTLQI